MILMKLELCILSNNLEIMMGCETDEITEEFFESLSQKYQEGLEESMKGREFIFDSVNSLHYKLHKISLNRGGSYMDSPEWLKNKKVIINPKNNDDEFFSICSNCCIKLLKHQRQSRKTNKNQAFY